MDNKSKNIIKIAGLVTNMVSKNATKEELENVFKFLTVVIDDQIEDGEDILEFSLLKEYHNKYC